MEGETSPVLLLMVGLGNLESVQIGDETLHQVLRNVNEQKGTEQQRNLIWVDRSRKGERKYVASHVWGVRKGVPWMVCAVLCVLWGQENPIPGECATRHVLAVGMGLYGYIHPLSYLLPTSSHIHLPISRLVGVGLQAGCWTAHMAWGLDLSLVSLAPGWNQQN